MSGHTATCTCLPEACITLRQAPEASAVLLTELGQSVMQGVTAQKPTRPNPEAHMTVLHELALASPEIANMTVVICSEVRSAARIACLILSCLHAQHYWMLARGAGGVRSVTERQSRYAQAGDRHTHGGLALAVARGTQPRCCTSHAEHQPVYADSHQFVASEDAKVCYINNLAGVQACRTGMPLCASARSQASATWQSCCGKRRSVRKAGTAPAWQR